MAQEYIAEPSDCLRWRRHTIQLLKKGEWDKMETTSCTFYECPVCYGHGIAALQLETTPLARLLLTHSEFFTPEIQGVIERVYGPQTPDSWYKMTLENLPRLSTLRYFIENRLISIDNGNHGYTLLSLYQCRSYRAGSSVEDTMEYLLSEEVGFNMNIQDCEGENVLLTYLRHKYYDCEGFDEDEREELLLLKYNQHIINLLEKGADPLLEDKNGLSALEYARNLSTFPQEKKERLIQILELYQ